MGGSYLIILFSLLPTGSDYHLFESTNGTNTSAAITTTKTQKPIPQPGKTRTKSLHLLNSDFSQNSSEKEAKKTPMIPKQKFNTTGCNVRQGNSDAAMRRNRVVSLPSPLIHFSRTPCTTQATIEDSGTRNDGFCKSKEVDHTYMNLSNTTSGSADTSLSPPDGQAQSVYTAVENMSRQSQIPTSSNIAYRGNSIKTVKNEAYLPGRPIINIEDEDATSSLICANEEGDLPIHSYDEPHAFWS